MATAVPMNVQAQPLPLALPAQPQQQQQVIYVQAQPVLGQQAQVDGCEAGSESCAMTLFVVGIFVPIVGLINMCIHCCHADPKVTHG